MSVGRAPMRTLAEIDADLARLRVEKRRLLQRIYRENHREQLNATMRARWAKAPDWRLHIRVEEFDARTVPEPNSGCLLWAGKINNNGYGVISIRCRHWLAHRIAWSLANDADIPDGMLVCHSCDTPACVNGAHLFLGDQATNTLDMVRKRRHAFGDRHACKNLNQGKVLEIRRLADAGASVAEVAARFGLSEPVVQRIVLRITWAGLT